MAATVLVVDDEPAVRMLARRMLETAGYEVFEAEDGIDALRVLGEHGRFDAVVSDVRMPHMDGRALAAYLAHLPTPIPTLLVSGFDEQQMTNPVMRKPFASVELLARVQELTAWPRQLGSRTS